ncbi:uncharacterized protein LOC121484470 isoform X1 [Vulpes lagopus]|uniref:uncharacterized protein LOC121484470 isoform X1 n=1 Tax=Vulpes lagopus TaxID=494514 RepID=UPI001BC8E0F3|nr:uncharacterized protein LOC121484470 isoform X1 [Vulpes lagopus]
MMFPLRKGKLKLKRRQCEDFSPLLLCPRLRNRETTKEPTPMQAKHPMGRVSCDGNRNYPRKGTADVQGCGRRILSGGVEMSEPYSAGIIQRCDVRELWTPPLRGSNCIKARFGLLFGAKEGTLGSADKEDSSHPSRILLQVQLWSITSTGRARRLPWEWEGLHNLRASPSF